MIQQERKDDLRLKILLQSSIKVKTDNLCKFIDKIVPLNENQAFIYYDAGSYEIYDVESQQIIGRGQISNDVKYFYQIYPQTLCFLDPEDMKVKFLDLKTHQLNQSFAFAASNVVKQNSEKQQKETLADKFRIMILDRESEKIRYFITQDLEKQYSNTNIGHFIIRVIPQNYTSDTQFDMNPVFEYNYPNKTGQTELYNWQVDEETFAVFGQDFELGQAEVLLIKPHLLEKAFYIIQIKDTISYTLINITNWIHPHLIAIWQNNNEGTAKPTIFTIDIRQYYDGQNWLPEPEYNPIKVRDDYVGDEPVTFVDIYQFQLNSTYVLQYRLVGVEPRLSLINYANIDKPELINEVKINDNFFHELPSNKSYLLQYNDLEIKDGLIEFSIVFPVDARHQLLQIIEKAKLIDKYGINNVEELFEFYQ
ncbi:unnamed protein product [Paramecium pentaurelia]|uniref:Uncharacterized protein n=1 Tax=Paramecium pentaurelia TaxID=43138 RepID=A0A8S1V5N9_9CILI|nr:unnamed protein product [Paramecium pentaurelia]